MPVELQVRGGTVVYVVVPPTVETRADAVACEVRRADVNQALVEDIERTIRLASRTLAIDPSPRVRWLPADTRDLRGITFGESLGEVWVKVQAPDKTKDTALHELRHVWQLQPAAFRWLQPELKTMEQRQADADDFARTWTWDMPAVTAPVGAHAQRSATTAGSERGRLIWEERYAPLHEAQRQAVAERQTWGRRRR
jgi:hypothetical protein